MDVSNEIKAKNEETGFTDCHPSSGQSGPLNQILEKHLTYKNDFVSHKNVNLLLNILYRFFIVII